MVECNGVLYFEIHVAAAAAKQEMGMYEQTKALLARYDELLEQFGSDRRHILKAEIILRDNKEIDDLNRAWSEWIEDGYQPAKVTTVGASFGDPYLVGIVLTAAVR